MTSNHGKRVAYLSARICRELGLEEPDIFDMACCAILHDSALTAYMMDAGPGDITRLEHFADHCVKGEANALAFPFLGDVRGIVLHHHENWNGSGFHKLKGREIPLRALVLRLADNIDLHLRLGNSRETLLEEVRAHVGKYRDRLYAPEVADALLAIVDEAMLRDMAHDHIHESLDRIMPDIRVDLNTDQLLRVCELFAYIIDAKSPFTRKHSSGLAATVGRVLLERRVDEEKRKKMIIAAYLHDVGKLSTPSAILEKPDALTAEEFAVMRDHVAMTREILSRIEGLEDIAAWAYNHHERLNGSGYCRGLTARDLDYECRLMACCDVYQALTEERPYRAGMSHDQAMVILTRMAEAGELDAAIILELDEVFSTPDEEEDLRTDAPSVVPAFSSPVSAA